MIAGAKTKGRKLGSGLQGEIADRVAYLLHGDPSRDWTIQDIVEGLENEGLFSDEMDAKSREIAKVYLIGSALRAARRNVGTITEPKYIRQFGVYPVYRDMENGRTKIVKCWKMWEDMNTAQMQEAYDLLVKHVKDAKQQAEMVFDYCNKLLAKRGKRRLKRRAI